jgi:hypothetical protein
MPLGQIGTLHSARYCQGPPLAWQGSAKNGAKYGCKLRNSLQSSLRVELPVTLVSGIVRETSYEAQLNKIDQWC